MTAQPIPPAIAQIAPDGNLTPRQMRHLLIQMSFAVSDRAPAAV